MGKSDPHKSGATEAVLGTSTFIYSYQRDEPTSKTRYRCDFSFQTDIIALSETWLDQSYTDDDLNTPIRCTERIEIVMGEG